MKKKDKKSKKLELVIPHKHTHSFIKDLENTGICAGTPVTHTVHGDGIATCIPTETEFRTETRPVWYKLVGVKFMHGTYVVHLKDVKII